jgi:hypothetical protein
MLRVMKIALVMLAFVVALAAMDYGIHHPKQHFTATETPNMLGGSSP